MSDRTWQDVYEDILEDVEKRSEQLTDREELFITLLGGQMQNPRFVISAKQSEWLDSIWLRLTRNQKTVQGHGKTA